MATLFELQQQLGSNYGQNQTNSQPSLFAPPDVVGEFARLFGLSSFAPAAPAPAPAPVPVHPVGLLPLPAAFPVFTSTGVQVPGLLTDGLGNFWAIIEDDAADDPQNVQILETTADEDLGLLEYPVLSGSGSGSGSGSDTAYSPAYESGSAGSPEYAEIDWELYSEALSGIKPQHERKGSYGSNGTLSPAAVSPAVFPTHQHNHQHPVSSITHPALSQRAQTPPRPHDDVAYPCPLPGCPASFRCASRGVEYAAQRMQLVYSDSVESGGDGEVVSDRDCEFVRHLFVEHEGELSSK